MKKVYMAPELVEVKIQKINLLTGSPTGTGDGITNPPGWGGVDPGDGTVVPEIPEILPPNLFDGFEGI